MKTFLTLIVFLITSTICVSQTSLEPVKEPSLVTFKENPGDTLALVDIKRIKNINEKLVYMYELMCIKDSLTSIVESYSDLVKTKNDIITSQKARIESLENYYKQSKDLLDKADKIISDQQKKIKTKNKIITALGISTGASVILLFGALLVK
jgi:ElaB/YqjD/DUF883 family membrane-anchored ribosome-binding protein